MRGKHLVVASACPQSRITPAHAGKTKLRVMLLFKKADHPRACGENQTIETPLIDFTGSPPRMRGKQQLLDYKQRPQRITPAHAGKTGYYTARARRRADHPRACGENRERLSGRLRNAGSPPRMRGKHFGNGVFPWLILVLSLDPL